MHHARLFFLLGLFSLAGAPAMARSDPGNDGGGGSGVPVSCECRLAGHSAAREILMMARNMKAGRVREALLGADAPSKSWCRERGALGDWQQGVLDEMDGRDEDCAGGAERREPPELPVAPPGAPRPGAWPEED